MTEAETYKAVRAVSRWLRIRSERPDEPNQQSPASYAKSGNVAGMFSQLAADVDHSGLLHRLLRGDEPLPREQYEAEKLPGHYGG